MRSLIVGKAQAAAAWGLRVLAMAYGCDSVESVTPPRTPHHTVCRLTPPTRAL